MSDEKEKQAAPVYPTPVTAPASVPAPVYPTPVTAPVPPVYPTPVTAPGYPTPVPPAKAETPYYPTTAPPPVPATPYGYPTTAPLSPASATTTTNGKVYQDQCMAYNSSYNLFFLINLGFSVSSLRRRLP